MFIKFIGKEPVFMGFCGFAEMKAKVKEILQEYNYAMINIFDRDTHRIQFVKIQEGIIVSSFGTIAEIKHEESHDS